MIDNFFKSLSCINGVGFKLLETLSYLLKGTRVKDLLFHTPISVIDRSYSPKICDTELNEVVTLKLKVIRHIPNPKIKRRIPYKIICKDDTGYITLIFFNVVGSYLKYIYKEDSEICVSGKVTKQGFEKVIVHPDYTAPINEFDKIAIIEPIYPLTYGITNKQLRSLILKVLKDLPVLPEWQLSPDISFNEALTIIHNPVKDESIMNKAKRRLAYDEILANQLALSLYRKQIKNNQTGIQINIDNSLINPFLKNLKFKLTDSQEKVLNEIFEDLKSSTPMIRLLQGDVGSGKTIIAFLSSLATIESMGQVAFMVPTEILALQHYFTLNTLIKNANLSSQINIIILTGKDKGKIKEEKINKIKNGFANIIIGTHALIEDNIFFKNLALVIIDEQHKFGVHQRLKLLSKNQISSVNILSMTATPIPRTLAMSTFGDMDISIIDKLPPNRQQIETIILNIDKIPELISSIQNKIKNKQLSKLYWVCPLVEESEILDLSAVEKRFEYLTKYFKDSVSILHGKMKAEDKEVIMKEFSDPNSKIKILVSTTVIEVGVDVPDATLMVIENAERFGLSSLHQLRGRIGRGKDKSTCILLHSHALTELAKQRLQIMKSTTDGFKIAQKDLELRGAGDLLGIKQSGLIDFYFANLKTDYDLFVNVSQYVQNILKDNNLDLNRWNTFKILLQLFDYDTENYTHISNK